MKSIYILKSNDGGNLGVYGTFKRAYENAKWAYDESHKPYDAKKFPSYSKAIGRKWHFMFDDDPNDIYITIEERFLNRNLSD